MPRRPVQEMPEDVQRELATRDLTAEYEDRPFYQRNDYLAWIDRAKRPETRRKRIDRMLAELEVGGVYMGMAHPPSRKARSGPVPLRQSRFDVCRRPEGSSDPC